MHHPLNKQKSHTKTQRFLEEAGTCSAVTFNRVFALASPVEIELLGAVKRSALLTLVAETRLADLSPPAKRGLIDVFQQDKYISGRFSSATQQW
jgi:hypothetical protein